MTAHDGSDYMHRQRILPHYQSMVSAKQGLKFTVILHILLSFLMVAKLLPTVLDMLNIFWQPIEELYVPMAQPWEWVWTSSVIFTLFAFSATKTNNLLQLKLFVLGIATTCMLPIFYCAFLYSNDFIIFILTKDASQTSEVWRNYPVALYWYTFAVVCCQVHGFELYFSWELLKSFRNLRTINKNK